MNSLITCTYGLPNHYDCFSYGSSSATCRVKNRPFRYVTDKKLKGKPAHQHILEQPSQILSPS